MAAVVLLQQHLGCWVVMLDQALLPAMLLRAC